VFKPTLQLQMPQLQIKEQSLLVIMRTLQSQMPQLLMVKQLLLVFMLTVHLIKQTLNFHQLVVQY